jgi:hypothetical protein
VGEIEEEKLEIIILTPKPQIRKTNGGPHQQRPNTDYQHGQAQLLSFEG